MLRNITFFCYLLLLMCTAAVNKPIKYSFVHYRLSLTAQLFIMFIKEKMAAFSLKNQNAATTIFIFIYGIANMRYHMINCV